VRAAPGLTWVSRTEGAHIVRPWTFLACGIALAGPATPALAESAPAFQLPALATGNQLTGDWYGARSTLLQNGIDIEAGLAVAGTMLSEPGLDAQRRYFQTRFSASVRIDTGPSLGLPGGTLFAEFESISGGDGSPQEGVLQPYSTLDAPHRDQLNQLWYRQALWSGLVLVTLGKIDVNAEFDSSPVAAPFQNRGLSFSPTIIGLPTYPDPATGAEGEIDLTSFYLKAGEYDGSTMTGVPTGEHWLNATLSSRFEIAEAGLVWGATPTSHLASLAVGGWQHTASFTRFDGTQAAGTRGAYALADAQPWSLSGGGGIALFAEGGFADPRVTRYARHAGGGVTSSEPGGPHANAIGLAATWVGTSREAGSPCDADETVFELFLRYQAAGWLILTPDVQWIRRPGGISTARDLYLGMVRADIAF
jgi:porin